ncbi:hypothetical protein TDIS_2102 [Thermosulfurimonas dismutans]|uniref:Restriction endonuclease type IV Mrr domain-containing protein n=1 Tax=Thermosulfurimonas dismutans TaxID=999894 RepID=A0A179D2D7_9BACT|nr:hypothetical protein TDIS_2102 [Thermosulfurimonas dismutans]
MQAKGGESPIGIRAIQEIYTAKDLYEAQEAWVITNSYFTKSAEEAARKLNVKLFNKLHLMRIINQVSGYNAILKIKKELYLVEETLEKLRTREQELLKEKKALEERLSEIEKKIKN